jgi:hypothetical protein
MTALSLGIAKDGFSERRQGNHSRAVTANTRRWTANIQVFVSRSGTVFSICRYISILCLPPRTACRAKTSNLTVCILQAVVRAHKPIVSYTFGGGHAMTCCCPYIVIQRGWAGSSNIYLITIILTATSLSPTGYRIPRKRNRTARQLGSIWRCGKRRGRWSC